MVGDFDDGDWLEIAKPDIIARMMEYEEDHIEFSILSLVKDPIVDLVPRLASNVKAVLAIDELLSALGVAEKEIRGDSGEDSTVYGPDASFELTQEIFDTATIPDSDLSSYKSGTREELLSYRQELINAQKELRASIKEEQQSYRADEDYAASRRHDYGPAIHKWAKVLARKGVIETLVQDVESC